MNPNSPSGQSTSGTSYSTTGTTLGSTDTLRDTAQDTYSETQSSSRRLGSTLRTELSDLKSDLDTLLGRAGSMTDDELRMEHARLMARFGSFKSAAKGVAAEANRQFNRGVEATSDYVRDKPLQAVAMASGVGLALGMLFGRR